MKKLIFTCLVIFTFIQISCKQVNDVKTPEAQKMNIQESAFEDNLMPVYIPFVIAGKAGTSGYVNGTGSNARFNLIEHICVSPDGSLLVTDVENNAIRKIKSPNVVSTVIQFNAAAYGSPAGVAVGGDGTNVYQTTGTGGYGDILYYKNGILEYTVTDYCVKCEDLGPVKVDPGGKSFWHTFGLDGGSGTVNSSLAEVKEFTPNAVATDFLIKESVDALSVCANGFKYFAAEHSLYSYKAGIVSHILPNTTFNSMSAMAANRAGTKIYLADGGDIKLVTQCVSGTCRTILTVLVKGAAATDIALSNSEKVLFFTSSVNNTVSKINLP